MGAGASTPGSAPLNIAAQEVYRVLLFLVFYAEIWLLGNVPLLGTCAGWCRVCTPVLHPLLQSFALQLNPSLRTGSSTAGSMNTWVNMFGSNVLLEWELKMIVCGLG